MVTTREAAETVRVQLASRFQVAIDEAAMRLGDTGSDAYLAGWSRGDWTPGDGTAAELAAAVVHDLETAWSEGKIARYLDELGASNAT